MMSTTHIALALIAAKFIYPPAQPLDWALVSLGAICPDFDAGGGMITHPSAWIPGLPRLFGRALDGTTRLASQATREIVGHRGPLHFPIIALGLWLLATYTHLPWLHFIAFGYAAHILADTFNKSGVPLWGPLSKKDVSFLPIRTGSAIEGLIGLAAWGYLGISLYQVIKRGFNPDPENLLTYGNTIINYIQQLLMRAIRYL